jgi:peptidoglycan-associated lipoprotein
LPAPTITLRTDTGATTATIERGGSVTIVWDARNAATVDIQPGIGQVTSQGRRVVNPASSVLYSATATGPGGSAGDNLRITVTEPAPVAPRGNTPVIAPPPTPNLTTAQLFERSMQAINFDYDKSDIRDDQKGKLQTAATYLKSNANIRLTIEGHCDERGSEEYNLALGDRRANAVKEYLVAQGIAANRLNSVSYGEERPVCRFQTEECFAQNRRAAFTLNP